MMRYLFTLKAMFFVTLLGMAASSKFISWASGSDVGMQTLAPWWVLALVLEDRCSRFLKSLDDAKRCRETLGESCRHGD